MTKLRRPCACRLDLEAEDTPEAIEQAVQEHQRTYLHRNYVERMLIGGWYTPTEKDGAMITRLRRWR